MAKSFNFNAMAQQTLEVTLGKNNELKLHVTTPPERLIEQLAASIDDLTTPGDIHDMDKVRASYTLVAALISCNVEGVTVTADDLRDKYETAPMVLAAFVAVYMDFINEFHNAKN